MDVKLVLMPVIVFLVSQDIIPQQIPPVRLVMLLDALPASRQISVKSVSLDTIFQGPIALHALRIA